MFQPVIPSGGIAGWRFLERTLPSQTETFANSPVNQRELDYFAEKIGDVVTAEQLVSDRRLRAVSLSAFGLQDDIDAIFFVRTILEEGTTENDALANRLTDPRYRAMARAFGFDNAGPPNTQVPGFADRIIDRFKAQTFEVAVGEQNESFRIALNAQRELAGIVEADGSDDSKWFRVLGTPPLRAFVEGALGMPSQISQIDLDQQLGEFRRRAAAMFGDGGSVASLVEPENLERLTDLYIVREQARQGPFGGGAGGFNPAVTLLSSASAGFNPALSLLRGF